jgi:Mce-associated membrane protein
MVGLLTVLAALVVVLGAAAAYLGVRYHSTWTALASQNALNSARADAVAAGARYAVDLSSYDYHDLDRDFALVTTNSTATFAKSYQQLRAGLGTLLVDEKAVATGSVLAEAVQSVSPTRAVLLVFVDQSVTNSSTTQPQVNHNRMALTLLDQAGIWRIDQVQLR